MRKKIPKPLVCQFCFKLPPFEIANLDSIYNDNKVHWRWSCRSCHLKYDYKNGVRKPYVRTPEILEKQNRNRVDNSGKNHPMYGKRGHNYGKKLSDTTKAKISAAKTNPPDITRTRMSLAATKRYERYRTEQRAILPPGMLKCRECKTMKSENEFVMYRMMFYAENWCRICKNNYYRRRREYLRRICRNYDN